MRPKSRSGASSAIPKGPWSRKLAAIQPDFATEGEASACRPNREAAEQAAEGAGAGAAAPVDAAEERRANWATAAKEMRPIETSA